MSSMQELLDEHERKLLAKQDIDSLLFKLRRAGLISLMERTYESLPDSCITAGDLRALIGDAVILVEELARASNHLYDELNDLGDELEARRRAQP